MTLYSVDHHHGSEEMQAGWPDHDASLIDPANAGGWTRSRRWRRRVVETRCRRPRRRDRRGLGHDRARLVDTAQPGLCRRAATARRSRGRTTAAGRPKVAPGGLLVFHDVFPDPADGGRPPYECYLDAIASGAFTEDVGAAVGSLRVLVCREEKSAVVAAPSPSASAARSAAAAE